MAAGTNLPTPLCGAGNYLVLQRMLGSNIACLLVEGIIVLFGFGLGLGTLVGDVDGVPYIVLIASALAVYTASIASAFEARDARLTRYKVQRTWEAM